MQINKKASPSLKRRKINDLAECGVEGRGIKKGKKNVGGGEGKRVAGSILSSRAKKRPSRSSPKNTNFNEINHLRFIVSPTDGWNANGIKGLRNRLGSRELLGVVELVFRYKSLEKESVSANQDRAFVRIYLI